MAFGSSASLAAVILAAGASTRMGQPKALLTWRGKTFLEHAISLARVAGASSIAVVEGAQLLPSSPTWGEARRVQNHRWPDGPLSSLQAGLLGLRLDVRPVPVLVLTLDRPHVEPATVFALRDACIAEPSRIWQPRHAGRHGHPILYPADLVSPLLALDPRESARELLGQPEVSVRRGYIDVHDPAVLQNIDTPEAYAELLRIG